MPPNPKEHLDFYPNCSENTNEKFYNTIPMIKYEKDSKQTVPTSEILIIGLGGAGANIIDRVIIEGLQGPEILAINADLRTLQSCTAKRKIQLGSHVTRGLGCGGDPDVGQKAALESETDIRVAIRGQKIIFLCVGLGGGTGSGAAPLITRIAREESAFTVVFATMPFAFEGARRRVQAETALNELGLMANALITFDNGRMAELVLANQGIHEAFSAANSLISDSIHAISRIALHPGIVHIGLDDLVTTLSASRSRCLFGSGRSGENDRVVSALELALSSPLLDRGKLLKSAEAVLVHICGGSSLTIFEAEHMMAELSKNLNPRAQIFFGISIDDSLAEDFSVTIISSLPEEQVTLTGDDATEARTTSSQTYPPTMPLPLESKPKEVTPIQQPVVAQEKEIASEPPTETEKTVQIPRTEPIEAQSSNIPDFKVHQQAPVKTAEVQKEENSTLPERAEKNDLPENTVISIEELQSKVNKASANYAAQSAPLTAAPKVETPTTVENKPEPAEAPQPEPEPTPKESAPSSRRRFAHLFKKQDEVQPTAKKESKDEFPIKSKKWESLTQEVEAKKETAEKALAEAESKKKPIFTEEKEAITSKLPKQVSFSKPENSIKPTPQERETEKKGAPQALAQTETTSLQAKKESELSSETKMEANLEKIKALSELAKLDSDQELFAGNDLQGELKLEGQPKGRFEGESPNIFEGEDLDIPTFLRDI